MNRPYKALANVAHDSFSTVADKAINFRVSQMENVTGPVPDYCNDINAAWPLMTKMGFNIQRHTSGPYNGQVTCSFVSGSIRNEYTHRNAMRAAAVLYLKLNAWAEGQRAKRAAQ